jgi:exopolysaccharide biosynthesis polyprenyl glycosylphosphotransferase
MDSSVAAPTDASRLSAPILAARGSQRAAVLGAMLAGADLVAALGGAATAVIAVPGSTGDAFLFLAAAAFSWPFLLFMLGLYGSDDLRTWVSGVAEIPRILVASLLFGWAAIGTGSLLDMSKPFELTAIAVVATLLLSSLARAGVRATLHRSTSLVQRTLIIGSGYVAGHLMEKLDRNAQFGLLTVGFVDDEVHDVGTPDLPHLGSLADLDEVITMHSVDRVIVAFSRAGHEQLLECIRVCRDLGIAVDVIPRLFEFLDGVRSLGQVGGLPVLSLGTPRLSRVSQASKRALDILGAGFFLIATAPVLAAVAIAIKLDSPGPVFFRQSRAGRDGRVFQLLKFRSMYEDADERKRDYLTSNDVQDGVMFKMHEDPRVTRVGRILRRLSLDECPQFINVLRGEMSLVGPRPLILPESEALAEDWHLRRLRLRPGLTGPWQIYGRSETPFQEMVRFDYQYVVGWSLARDVEILIATVPAVLSGRGAY